LDADSEASLNKRTVRAAAFLCAILTASYAHAGGNGEVERRQPDWERAAQAIGDAPGVDALVVREWLQRHRELERIAARNTDAIDVRCRGLGDCRATPPTVLAYLSAQHARGESRSWSAARAYLFLSLLQERHEELRCWSLLAERLRAQANEPVVANAPGFQLCSHVWARQHEPLSLERAERELIEARGVLGQRVSAIDCIATMDDSLCPVTERETQPVENAERERLVLALIERVTNTTDLHAVQPDLEQLRAAARGIQRLMHFHGHNVPVQDAVEHLVRDVEGRAALCSHDFARAVVVARALERIVPGDRSHGRDMRILSHWLRDHRTGERARFARDLLHCE
jgi:hypothetical protein